MSEVIITELSENELFQKYPDVISRYMPYVGTIEDADLLKKINIALKKTLGLWVYKKEPKESIRCLCPKCLHDYIQNPNYLVRRLDHFAKVKEKCDKCDKLGWDYVITEKQPKK